MATEDLIEYWEKLAADAGLPPEKAEVVKEALQNEKVRNGFVTRSSYSRDLDKVREESIKKGMEEGTKKSKAFYDDWWTKEGEPAHKQAMAILDEYNQLVSLYGKPNGDSTMPTNPQNLSKSELEALRKEMEDRISATNSAYVDMLKKSMLVASKHLHEFGEPLDPNDLENYAKEHGYSDINQAYSAYIAPRVTEREQAKHKEALAKAREEGLKEGLSRSHAPTAGDRVYDNPFLRTPEGEVGRDAARADFFTAFDEQST